MYEGVVTRARCQRMRKSGIRSCNGFLVRRATAGGSESYYCGSCALRYGASDYAALLLAQERRPARRRPSPEVQASMFSEEAP